MKIRNLDLCDTSFRLAPLTLGQVEEIVGSGPPVDVKAGRIRSLQTIAYAIGNAGGSITVDELKRKLDLEDYLLLHEAVLELSDLKSHGTAEAPSEDPPEKVDFDDVRCMLASSTGWTFEEMERTPFPFVVRLCDYFAEFPPQHLLMRGYVGYKPPLSVLRRNRGNRDSSEEDKKIFVGMWGGNVRPLTHLPPALQLALSRMDPGDPNNN